MPKNYENIMEWLVLIGGTNLGLSLFNINVIQMIADATAPFVLSLVYGLVGASAVYMIYEKVR